MTRVARATLALAAIAFAGVAAADPPPTAPPPAVPIIPEPPPNGKLGPPPDDHPHPPAAGSGSAAGSAAGSDAGSSVSVSVSGSGGSASPDLPSAELTARDSDGAPIPGAESGRTDLPDDAPSPLRVVGRVVLFIPKTIYQALFLPVRGTFFVLDRYHLDQLYYRVFFNANHTIGLVPTGTYESGIGLSIGLRFQMSDVFGDGERFAVQGTTGAILGDSYREGGLIEAHTGHRLGRHLELNLLASFDRRPEDAFYGLGNGNQTTTPPPAPVDPVTSDYAYEVTNRYQESRLALTGDLHPSDFLHFLVTGALTDLRFAPSTYGTPLPQIYNPADIPGFLGGVEHAYGELEVRWDTRHRATLWEPVKMFSGGSLVSVYAGRIDRLDGGTDFWRYGGELQHFFRLGRGPRTLITRLRAAGVSGPLSQVPFTELTELGGADFLRGYSYNRFRDRASLLGSVQYSWDLSYFVDAYVFTDVGRVYDSFDDLTARAMRLGYGVGLDLHGESGLLMTINVASSIDGGMQLILSFNQATDARPRWR